MKLRTQILSLAGAAILGSALLAGCTSTSTGPTTTDNRTKVVSLSGETKHVVTGLLSGHMYVFSVTGSYPTTKISAANSASNSAVTVFWTRDPSDNGADTINYMEVTSETSTDPVTSAPALTWAPAMVSGTYTLYETADNTNGHYSGLIFSDSGARTASVLSPTDAGKLDLVLITDNSLPGLPYLSVVAPAVNGTGITGGRETYFGIPYQVKGGMTNQKFSTSIVAEIAKSGANFFDAWDIPNGNFADSSIILVMATADNHYARVEIVPQADPGHPGQTLLWKDVSTPSGSRRAIVVNVSYQATAGWGYVGRPGVVRRGTNIPVVKATGLIRQ